MSVLRASQYSAHVRACTYIQPWLKNQRWGAPGGVPLDHIPQFLSYVGEGLFTWAGSSLGWAFEARAVANAG